MPSELSRPTLIYKRSPKYAMPLTRHHCNVHRLYAGGPPLSVGFALNILNYYIAFLFRNISFSILCAHDPGGQVGLRPLACWDCGFECRRGHGCLSFVTIVCYWADHSSGGVIPSVVCLSVIVKSR